MVPFVKVWIHFVYEETWVSEVFRLKPKPRGDCSPLVKTSGNMGNRRNKGRSGDKRLHGCGYKMLALSGIKSGLCSFICQSDIRFEMCGVYQYCQGWFN